ncbi:MAG: ATP-binding protein [Candidatus Eisenbacteria bacterium]|nr:ATP-binding protein [Candidatus Eisenbacteria bacterium]
MTRRVPIQIDVGNALRWLGTLYRNPADALKEHVSNAVDEHAKARLAGSATEPCRVRIVLEKRQVVIEYPYGMDRREFEAALQRVADSAKKQSDVAQIGRLGIGMFSFQQIGRKCTFYSKKTSVEDTVRVILSEGGDDAKFDSAPKRESLENPGIRIVISELKLDPTRSRGPLSVDKLAKLIGEKFDGFLRNGTLAVEVKCGDRVANAEPPRIDLPRLAENLAVSRIPWDPAKEVRLRLHFDPSGKGVVGIRHAGVEVVEDIKRLEAYGLEESVLASGYVGGTIEADFLEPLPARTGFEEGADWITFLAFLDKQIPQIEAEVGRLREEAREREISEIQREALRLAREILDAEDFRDLELLRGLARERKAPAEKDNAPAELPAAGPSGEGLPREPTGERSREPGDRKSPTGFRVNYEEVPFESGPSLHSRFAGGRIQVNDTNPDYAREMAGSDEAKLAYATLMIGKETIAHNDRSGRADEFLEKLLSFYFCMKHRISPAVAVAGKRGRGRPRKKPPE